MRKKIVLEVISSLLILLFLYTSLSKWLNFTEFTGDMNNQPFPNSLTPWLVWSIPIIEILIVIALLFERTRTAAFYASLFLMSAFTIYTIVVLLRAFDYIPCSCGGVIKSLTWTQHLFFNIFFVGISVAGIILRKKTYAIANA